MSDVGKPSDWVTFRDLLAAVGVSERTARSWDLPAPEHQVGKNHLWYRRTLVAWLRAEGRGDAADRLRDA